MARSQIEAAHILRSFFDGGNKRTAAGQTLSATYVVDDDSPSLLFLDANGAARDVRLPAATGTRGLSFTIVNTATAAFALTVKDSAGATTFGVIGQNEAGQFFSDGTTWWGDTTSDITALSVGASAGDRVTVKGIYKNASPISVAVPSITDPDIARVQVDVSAAFTFQPAVGDAVVAIPLAALPTNSRFQGAWVYQTDGIELVFGSEGGSVTGAARNFDFLIFDLT